MVLGWFWFGLGSVLVRFGLGSVLVRFGFGLDLGSRFGFGLVRFGLVERRQYLVAMPASYLKMMRRTGYDLVSVGLGWIGLGWVGLARVRSGWVGLGRVGLG